jgi:type I restriction enzyme, S subunit
MRINVGSIGLVRDVSQIGKISPDYVVFSTRHTLLPEFLYSYLKSTTGQKIIRASTSGAVRDRLYFRDLARLSIPLPPLAEQERIVKLLDEADELRRLRAAADKRAAELIPALFNEMFGEPSKNPKGWPIRHLGELAELGSGATPSKKDAAFWTGSTPWVSPKDMKADEITDAEDHVSTVAFEKTNLQLIPKDTVLIVVRGMILAHTVPVRICRVPVAINQDMKALLPKQPLEPEFLRWSLQSQHVNLLNHVSTAGHGTKKLDSERLREIEIPNPPLPLQKTFTGRVSEVRELEAEQGASRRQLDHLFQSMLHRAFNGAL